MILKTSYLMRPGNGQNTAGAFYIAVEDGANSFVLYGTNTGGGTVKAYSEQEVTVKLAEKRRREYRDCPVGNINQTAIARLLEEARKRHSNQGTPQATAEGIVFGTGAQAVRPRSRKSAVHGWF